MGTRRGFFDRIKYYLKSLGDILDRIKWYLKPLGNIIVLILFALLPLFVSAASVASKSDVEFFPELFRLLSGGSIFIYVSTFIAPYFYSLIFEKGFRNRENVMCIFLLAIWALLVGAFLYSGVFDPWGGVGFPSYIETSVLLAALVTWYFALYTPFRDSSWERSQKSIDDALEIAVGERR